MLIVWGVGVSSGNWMMAGLLGSSSGGLGKEGGAVAWVRRIEQTGVSASGQGCVALVL